MNSTGDQPQGQALPLLPAQAEGYTQALRARGGEQQQALLHGAGAGRGGELLAALYTSPPYDLQVPALAVPRLSITLTPAPVHGALEGDRARAWRTPRHALFLTPAGAAAHWRKPAPSRHINLYFHEELLHDDAGDGRRFAATPLFNVQLPGLGPLVDTLARELASPAHWAAEAADSLGRLILVHAARRHRSPKAEALPPAALARVREFVQAHLSQRVRVAELAQLVGLSPSHFAHAYTRVTGRSPHQAVLEARVARAQQMLRNGSAPLAEVALACGFASQQHLSRVLRQRTGLTPSALRRNAQGAADDTSL
jgi:AraC family transcriptional regulator